MKIIIDIPEEIYQMVMNTGTFGIYRFNTAKAIRKGTPLDDVKAEIEQFREDLAEKAPSLKDLINAQRTVDICLGIIDNFGKGE